MIKQRINAGKTELFDPVRKKWLLCTEEEKVRQCFLMYLMEEKKIPLSHLSVEREIEVNGLSKRYDIVVFDTQGKPYIIIECKAPEVKLTQDVIEQAGRYNMTLRAPIIGITNGRENYFFHIDFETEAITFIDDLP